MTTQVESFAVTVDARSVRSIISAAGWTSALGPTASWPPTLVAAVNLILPSPIPHLIVWGSEGAWFYNDAFAPLLGGAHPALFGCRVAADRSYIADVVEAGRQAVSGGRVAFCDDANLPLVQSGVEDHAWFDLKFSPLVDGGGAHCGLLAVAIDVSDRRIAEREQFYLARDVQHRVQNILAMARSIVSRTEATSYSVDDFGTNAKGRIDALARVQSVLMRRASRDASLAEIVLDELRIQGGGEDRIVTRGPPVLLPTKAAETLGLVFHELATNAAKFGALSARRGVLTVDWRLDRSVCPTNLIIDWTETGIAAIGRAPRRKGFGWSLIEESIPYELQGTVDLKFSNGAFHCHICVPLVARGSDVPGSRGKTRRRPDTN